MDMDKLLEWSSLLYFGLGLLWGGLTMRSWYRDILDDRRKLGIELERRLAAMEGRYVDQRMQTNVWRQRALAKDEPRRKHGKFCACVRCVPGDWAAAEAKADLDAAKAELEEAIRGHLEAIRANLPVPPEMIEVWELGKVKPRYVRGGPMHPPFPKDWEPPSAALIEDGDGGLKVRFPKKEPPDHDWLETEPINHMPGNKLCVCRVCRQRRKFFGAYEAPRGKPVEYPEPKPRFIADRLFADGKEPVAEGQDTVATHAWWCPDYDEPEGHTDRIQRLVKRELAPSAKRASCPHPSHKP